MRISYCPYGQVVYRITLIWLLGCLFPVGLSAGVSAVSARITADDLVYVTEHFPPHNYMENGRLKGISVDILELVWKELGAVKTRNQVRLMPWARAIKLLESSPCMVLFGMAYSRERALRFQWVGPYLVNELALIGRREDPVEVKTLDDARQLTIGVVRLDIGHQFLKDNAFDPARLDTCDDIRQLHEKFMHNRFRVVCCVVNAYFKYAETRGIPPKALEKVFTLSRLKSGYGFSRQIPADLVNQFQAALDRLKSEGAVDKILTHYRVK